MNKDQKKKEIFLKVIYALCEIMFNERIKQVITTTTLNHTYTGGFLFVTLKCVFFWFKNKLIIMISVLKGIKE